jgi:cyclic beta-1,2-glucan synthetase
VKDRTVRVVFAFYSAEEAHAESAVDALKSSENVCLAGPGPAKLRQLCARYRGLRLEGETMVVVETRARRIEAVVRKLRLQGSPAIFVVRPDFGPDTIEKESAVRPDAYTGVQNRRSILARLQQNSVALESARRCLMEATQLDHPLMAAAEWILDNSYLIRTQVVEVQRHLPGDYTSRSGTPKDGGNVNELAHRLVASTDHVLSEDNIRDAIREYQVTGPLLIAELWAFPLFLRTALIETLTCLAARVSDAQQLRESAYLWANRLASSARSGSEVFGKMLRNLEADPVARHPYFVTSLAEQLQDEEIALGPAQRWIEERFGTSLTEVVRKQHTEEAAEVISTANAFTSLRAVSRIDFTKIFEEVSLVEAELRLDPSGVYARSDFATRDRCRGVVERVARYSHLGEREVAALAIAMASGATDPHQRYVGHYLLSDGLGRLEKASLARIPARIRIRRAMYRHPAPVYLGLLMALTACFTILAGVLAWEAGVRGPAGLAVLAVLALFPLSELSTQIVNALVISLLPPDTLPKMDFRGGIPSEHATLVVVPMMLSGAAVVRAELEKLEVRFLGNRNENIFYSLFSDFLDSGDATDASDGALLQTARDGIASLNSRYPGNRFLLFHRAREWSEGEQKWIGRERKRGKLEDLNAFLCGDGHREILQAGQLPLQIAFVITLDSDTQLPVESARRLIETVAHPLNRVEIDAATGIRKRGYTIIQPRVSITLPGATATRFTRIFADATGTDPYCQAVSDAQQDLFLEAIFHGKAIYDVKAFYAIAGNRFPAETLLSHDLIEGAYVGVGLATDIELFEHLPVDYASFAARQHRWIRGDWQIARWVLRSVPVASGKYEPNPLSVIDRWRILDNLRRSLVPVAALLLLLMGWLISAAPGVWSLVVGLAVAIPATAPLLDRLVWRIHGSVHRWQGAADDLIRSIVMAAFLPHQAWISLDAIARVVYRHFVSHRGLLEWKTADHARSDAHLHTNTTRRQMRTIAAFSLVLSVLLLVKHAFAPTSMFVILWAASPMLMRWMALPAASPERRGLGAEEIVFLRRLARHTWRFFDDLTGPESNWLPPDNTQLSLRVEVAQRTSPTNIGFWLTGLLAARDFGYVTTDEFCRRGLATMETVNRMERYEGHLLNWYDTRTLEPLAPRYVSTVDSGNLLAALWVLEQGCRDSLRVPIIGIAAVRGLDDTLSILEKVCVEDPSAAAALHGVRRLLHGSKEGHELIAHFRMAGSPMTRLEETRRWHRKKDDEEAYWAARLSSEFNSWIETADRYLRWMETLEQPPDATVREIGSHPESEGGTDLADLRQRAMHAVPSIGTLAGDSVTPMDTFLGALRAAKAEREFLPEVAGWVEQLSAEYAGARARATETVNRIEALAGAASKLADGINMRFLYDAKRKLFGVGYAVGGPREFQSHYDLLASECRLASLVAVAKGDVPVEHWRALNRPYSYTRQGQALLSWSGTMFEYLMPLLFTRTFANSILEVACRDAVARQMEYGEAHNIPWGISESAYSALDSHRIYQYKAFGVPALALNPGLEDELVVAPYASVLALLVNPVAATQNLERLQALGLAGPMGFYEAIDFTHANERFGEPGVVIYSYMAHHQGMTLAALDNVLHRDVMQRRFHGDLRIRSVEALLFERNPITRLPKEEVKTRLAPIRAMPDEGSADRTWTEETTAPRVHLHGNGHLAIATTNSGGGYIRWNEFDLTRWRSDPTLDPWGSFIYIRDVRTEEVWATTYKPFSTHQGESSVRFAADRVEMKRRFSGIETVLELTVSAEDDAELRRVRITNRSLRARQLELTSYLELAMAPHRADTAHPAFAKMFIETEYPESGILIAHRRPRSAEESPIWTGHILVGAPDGIQYETDRVKFLGRGNTPETAVALRNVLSGTTGTVIDPIFSLRCRITLDPRDRKELTFITVAANTREAVLELVHKYQRAESITRAFEMAWTRAQLEFRFLRIGPGAAHRFQELASPLLYPNSRLRPSGDRLVKNRLGQPGLWAYGISGDLPMLVVAVSDSRHLALVREVLLAHAYWRLRGFKADLIILNQESTSYDQPLRQELLRQIEAHTSDVGMDKPGGVFLRDWHGMPDDGRNLLFATAGIVLNGTRGPLQQQLTAAAEGLALPPFVPVAGIEEEPSAPLPFLELPYFNGLGGFTPDGKEYAIYLKPGVTTPAPWVNVMSNRRFGTMVSESGLGFTWLGNSQTNRLTPWHNDPVSDPQSEVIYLRDEETGAVWTPTALPAREKDAYRARHGHGYTVYEHNSHSIGQELTVFVPVGEEGAGDPVKVCRLRLRNDSSRQRRLTATWFGAWVLGAVREDQQLHVLTSRDEESGAVMARQYWSGAFAGQVAFAASSPRAVSWSADRTQFLGRNGTFAKPAALDFVRLDNRTGASGDPAGALQVSITLERDQQSEVIFLLGQTESVESMRAIVNRYKESAQVDAALAGTRDWWAGTLGALQVKTPVLSTDFLLNGWLLYQALSCRFWGRSALYQSSGALGFRDQLQDCLAFVYAAPQLARQHILAAAARQFLQGDVQHWWHAETGMGVRTRCSDDLLWLPFVAAQYVTVTGDAAILEEMVPFLEGPVLAEGEMERMFSPAVSAQTAPLWEHCHRAIGHGWRLGAQGLPLIGNGDWNDGMNLVGAKGQGESVWLGWFLCTVLEGFAQVWEARGDTTQLAPAWREKAAWMKKQVEQTAWDGEWYLRGFFDNGTPLGSHVNEEARIDSLPQSWAVISGAGDRLRARQAMESAERNLVREKEKLVLLLAPPFNHSVPNPGYIMGYPPGLRENGGQYTHGALWLAMAWARMNEGGRAVRLLQMMNPAELTRTPETVAHYRGEPYVVAADVSLGAGRAGQCGWTWYTGSAAWMYRVWIEEVLGLKVSGDRFTVKPSLPAEWPGFELTWRYGSTVYQIKVMRGSDRASVKVDGREMADGFIPLVRDGGIRHVDIVMAEPRLDISSVEDMSGTNALALLQ